MSLSATASSFASPATSRRKTSLGWRDRAEEVDRGFDALRDVDDGVSVFGSARVKEGHPWYELCRETAPASPSTATR